LHSDIQGFEVEMLQGSEKTLQRNGIDWFFISTHNEDLHRGCEEFLQKRGISIVASVSPAESYSVDGILVGRAAHVPPLAPLELSRRKAR
jgi:hypothetical protein